MKKKYVRQIYCICMSIIFLIGIFGQTNNPKSHPDTPQVVTETGNIQSTASYLSAEILTRMDDFHITAEAGRTLTGSIAGVRGVTVWMAALILLWFFGTIPPKRRICFRKKKIPVFRIVTFIHQTDGKKKSCFDNQNYIKTGGLTWRLVQSIRFCL